MPERDSAKTWAVRYNHLDLLDIEPDEGVTRSNSSPTTLDQYSFDQRINALCVHYGLTPGLFAHLMLELYSWRLNGHLAGEWAYVPCLASETNSVSAALDVIEHRIGGTP